jgi:folylpolyglutamate synthase/dihydropteroate synthase
MLVYFVYRILENRASKIHYICYIIKIKERMRLNQSYISKENVNITFTYKDRTDNSFFKNKNVFQSVIFSKPNDVRGPLA